MQCEDQSSKMQPVAFVHCLGVGYNPECQNHKSSKSQMSKFLILSGEQMHAKINPNPNP